MESNDVIRDALTSAREIVVRHRERFANEALWVSKCNASLTQINIALRALDERSAADNPTSSPTDHPSVVTVYAWDDDDNQRTRPDIRRRGTREAISNIPGAVVNETSAELIDVALLDADGYYIPKG
jgi:hypothetical protein